MPSQYNQAFYEGLDPDMQETMFKRLAILGYANSGSAINNAYWFTETNGVHFAIVLLVTREFQWKAYIGLATIGQTELFNAIHIAENGAKVTKAMAIAAFPDRFDPDDYAFTHE